MKKISNFLATFNHPKVNLTIIIGGILFIIISTLINGFGLAETVVSVAVLFFIIVTISVKRKIKKAKE